MLNRLKINRNNLSDSSLLGVLEFRNFLPVCVWKVGETVALVVCGSSQEIVNPQLVFELCNIGPVVSRNRRERGTPHASSVLTQQEFLEWSANSALKLARRVVHELNRQSSRRRLSPEEKEEI